MADPFTLSTADQPVYSSSLNNSLEKTTTLGLRHEESPKCQDKAWIYQRHNSKQGQIQLQIQINLKIDSAEELWHDLKERFEHGNGPRIFELKRELMNLKQDAMTVSQYFTRIKMLWEELSSYHLVPCNCGDARLMHDFFQSEYVHFFLMGLDESFTQIRAQILLMKSIPAINKVLSLVVQEERHRIIGASSSSN
ncbi:uncharacterized protein LOC130984730 [Arachis stenosperma]|uniref:uncharacterized protein LOC130984730 n=1 Tax=Arachis stenosperma TaxID=217475 RepID=UPI0025AC10CA|nr:uncharacterized protein LOC130984730 [Arachis stenosperma]